MMNVRTAAGVKYSSLTAIEVMKTPGDDNSTISNIMYFATGVLGTLGVCWFTRKWWLKTSKPTHNNEVNYVFFSTDGKPLVISESDMYSIKQMYEDGAMPSVIGKRHNLSPVMVCRIINYLNVLSK